MKKRATYSIEWVRCSTGEVMSCAGLPPLLVFRRLRELLRHETNVTILGLRREAMTEKVETPVRCPSSGQPVEDAVGPGCHCDTCGKYYPVSVIRAHGNFWPEHRLLRDAPGRSA